MRKCMGALALWGAGLLIALAAPMSAAPIQYDFVSGSADIEVTIDGNTVFSVSTDLDGTFVIYDDMTSEIPDFELLTDDTISLGPIPFFDEFSLTLTATPGAGYTSGPGVSNDVDLGPVMINILGLVEDVDDVVSDIPLDEMVSAAFPIGVDVSVVGSTATFDVSEMLVSFSKLGHDFVITKNVQFVGVPEAGSAALLGSAIVGLALRRRRA